MNYETSEMFWAPRCHNANNLSKRFKGRKSYAYPRNRELHSAKILPLPHCVAVPGQRTQRSGRSRDQKGCVFGVVSVP